MEFCRCGSGALLVLYGGCLFCNSEAVHSVWRQEAPFSAAAPDQGCVGVEEVYSIVL